MGWFAFGYLLYFDYFSKTILNLHECTQENSTLNSLKIGGTLEPSSFWTAKWLFLKNCHFSVMEDRFLILWDNDAWDM